MKTSGKWITLVGIAAVAVLVARTEAAENAKIQKIVDLIKAGKNDEARAAAKTYAKDHTDVEELMAAFGKKGGMSSVGVEPTIIKFGRDTATPATLGKTEYQDIGAIVQAVAMITEAIPAPKSPKAKASDWTKWAKDVGENGAKLQAAIKSKTPADVKMYSSKINAACNSCHTAFK